MANQYKNKIIYNGNTLIDLSDTTAVQSDVASGKYFYTASGERVGGTATATSITITDEANTTGTTCIITSGSSTPSNEIPLNTQLIDYTKVVRDYIVAKEDGTELSREDCYCCDYTVINPSMTFSFIGYTWFDIVFYDSNKTFISGVIANNYADTVENEIAHGTLIPSRIPANAMYVRFSGYPTAYIGDSSYMSLIRTA